LDNGRECIQTLSVGEGSPVGLRPRGLEVAGWNSLCYLEINMTRTFRVIIEPDGKHFHGYVPVLKGCHTWGKTVAETKKYLQEAVELHVESMVAHGEAIPDDSGLEAFTTIQMPMLDKISLRKTVGVRQYA